MDTIESMGAYDPEWTMIEWERFGGQMTYDMEKRGYLIKLSVPDEETLNVIFNKMCVYM